MKALALGHQTVCHLLFRGDGDGKKKWKAFEWIFPFRREKIINAFIDSIKMKDYCNASRSFPHVARGGFGMKMEDYV